MRHLDLKNEKLDDLYEMRSSIETSIDNFFDEGETVYTGDQGYQDLCEDLGDVQDEINERIGYEE